MIRTSGDSILQQFAQWIPPTALIGTAPDRIALAVWEQQLGHSVFVADAFELAALDQMWRWWESWAGAEVQGPAGIATFPATPKGWSDFANDYVTALSQVPGAGYPVQLHTAAVERVLRQLGIPYRPGDNFTARLIEAGIVNPQQVAVVQATPQGTVTTVLAGSAVAVGDVIERASVPEAAVTADPADPLSLIPSTAPGLAPPHTAASSVPGGSTFDALEELADENAAAAGDTEAPSGGEPAPMQGVPRWLWIVAGLAALLLIFRKDGRNGLSL